MSAPSNTTVAALFKQLEVPAPPACSRQEHVNSVLDMHGAVARHYAESAYITLTTAPDFVDATVSNDELAIRMQAAFDVLISGAAAVRAEIGLADDVTRILAEGRLIHAYHSRFNEIALQACLVRGGRA